LRLERLISLRSPQAEVCLRARHSLYIYEAGPPSPVLAVETADGVGDEKLAEWARRVEALSFERVGERLSVDVVAVRHVARRAERLAEAVEVLSSTTKKPMILCSFDTQALRLALKSLDGHRPLLYAATGENWREMANLATRYDVPLAVSEPDHERMRALIRGLGRLGVREFVLDFGLGSGSEDWLAAVLRSLMKARKASLNGVEEFRYPFMAVVEETPEKQTVSHMTNALTASALMLRYADLIILHETQNWALLPLLVLKQELRSDPHKPPKVRPGLRRIGSPGVDSPVLITSNYRQTYYIVKSDLEDLRLDCYLLVVDTGGLSVRSAVAGGQLNPDVIAEALRGSGVEGLVKRRLLILPGYASHLKDAVERLTGWRVLVGPKDSMKIGEFLAKNLPEPRQTPEGGA